MYEAIGVVVGDVAGMSFDMDHLDSAAASFVFYLVEIAVDSCSFHVGLGSPGAVCNIGSVLRVVAYGGWFVATFCSHVKYCGCDAVQFSSVVCALVGSEPERIRGVAHYRTWLMYPMLYVKQAFHEQYGVTNGNPAFMLGVKREITTLDDGTRVLEYSMPQFIEDT